MKIKLENFDECIVKIANKGKISSAEAADILQLVADRGEKLRNAGIDDPFINAAGSLGAKLIEEAKIAKADAVLNAGKRTEVTTRFDADGPSKIADNVRSLLYWTGGRGKESDSIQSLGVSLTHLWMGYFNGKLDARGITKFATSRETYREISRAIWALKSGAAVAAGAARDVAQIGMDALTTVLKRLNSEGAHINDAIDYITHTNHERSLILRGGRGQSATNGDASFERWYRATLPNLNVAKTFADVTPRPGETMVDAQRRFLRSVYGVLTTGIHKDSGIGQASRFFEGTSNIARRLSEGRVLFFKDADSWMNYMDLYGRSTNFYEALLYTMHSGGRNAALMHYLGTNPLGNFRMVIQGLKEKYRDSHPAEMLALDKNLYGGGPSNFLRGRPPVERVLALLGAVPHRITDDMENSILLSIAQGYNMVSLGNVGLANLAFSVTSFPSVLRMNGFTTLGALARMFKELVPDTLRGPERAEVLRQLGAYSEGVIAPAFDPLMNGITAPGVMSSIHHKFMKATGVQYALRHIANGAKWQTASLVANNIKRGFNEIPEHLRLTLTDYGISETEWKLLQLARGTRAKGISYITPSSVFTIPDSAFGIAPELVQKAKQELSDRLLIYYNDIGEHAATNPGVREQGLLLPDPQSGSTARAFRALLTQYMGGPLAASHQVLSRLIYNSKSNPEMIGLLATFAGISMLGGYINMQVRNLIAGRPVDEPKNWQQSMFLALRSFAAGGMLGVYADQLFGNIGQAINPQGIGGPIVSDLADLSQIAYKWAFATEHDRNYNAWSELGKFGLRHVPFVNLPYLKGAWNYLLFYHLQESLQPGWWERTNQKMLQEQGKSLAGYMPGAPIPSTPYGLGESR